MKVLCALGKRRLMLLPFAYIYVFIMLILSRVIQVNILEVPNDRLGHFATNTELSYLTLIENQKSSCAGKKNIYCVTSTVSCNTQLETMWRRVLNIRTGEFGWLVNDLCRRLNRDGFYLNSDNCDIKGLFSIYPPTLFFTEREERIGNDFLKNCGVASPEKLVCLNVRDSAYLSETKALNWNKSRDWSYHNYRNAEIREFRASAETLDHLGYSVFRMGSIVKDPLNLTSSNVIDYATNGMRTDFLDVFLGAKCKFCVSTGSGWDSVPQIFRRPTLYVNFLPYFSQEVLVRDVTVFPKLILDKTSGSLLGLRDLMFRDVLGVYNTHEYHEAGVVIRDLSSEELVEAVTEMAQRVEGTFVETPEQKEMQAKLKRILSTHPQLQPSPNYYPIRAQFASCFLSRYPNFLDGLE